MSVTQSAPLPVCKAILLCKQVVKKETGELDLIGVIGNFFVDRSLNAPPAELFCQFTDAMGRYKLVVEVHDLGANEVVGRTQPTAIEVDDPLLSVDVIMSISGMQFRNVGLHDIVVLANDEEIDRKQFGVAYREEASHVAAN